MDGTGVDDSFPFGAKGWLLVSGSVCFQIISSMCFVGLPILNPKFPSRKFFSGHGLVGVWLSKMAAGRFSGAEELF